MSRWLIALLAVCCSLFVQAATVEPRAFDGPGQEARYKHLIAELRCLVCQNQNLADSDADLAKDLRQETYEMVRAGKSDEEIVSFMVNRYGDFVLYRPPVKSTTALLWYGPLGLVLIAVAIVVIQVRRRAKAAPGEAALSDEEKQRLERLLSADKGDSAS